MYPPEYSHVVMIVNRDWNKTASILQNNAGLRSLRGWSRRYQVRYDGMARMLETAIKRTLKQ